MPTPQAHLVDDDEAIRDALAWLLQSRQIPCRSYLSAEDFLAAGPEGLSGCVVLDIRMTGMSGLELFETLQEQGITLPIIFLTGHGDVPTAVSAVKRGAFDFVEKPFSNNALVDRVEHALQASAATLAARRQVDAVQRLLGDLTDRERDVMQLVVEGRPNKLIADALGISVRTVEVHRARVFDKMGVKSAVELANLLRQA